jgi:hypothetical protein
MTNNKFSKGQITSVEKNPTLQKYVYGDTFGPGDYPYSEPTTYTVHVEGEEDFVVDKATIMRNFPGKKNVTEERLKELVGKDADVLR